MTRAAAVYHFANGCVLATVSILATACGGALDAPIVQIGPTGADTEDVLVAAVVDRNGAPDDALPAFSWFRDGAQQVDLAGPEVPADRTTRGETWEVRVSWVGEDGEPGIASLTIANAPPLTTVALSPTAPSGGDDLVASASHTDPDGDAVTTRWSWKVNGGVTTESGPTLDEALTDDGDEWEVTAVGNDGTTDGNAAIASVIIGNHAPLATLVTLGPEPANETTILIADAVVEDPDGDAVSLTWRFTVGATVVQEGPSDTLTGASFDRDDTVVATLLASDGESTASFDSNVVVIGNAGPQVLGLGMVPASPREADLVDCTWSAIDDPDGDSIAATTLTWYVDGAEVQTGGQLGGSDFDKHAWIVCEVVAVDVDGAAGPIASADAQVDNTPPVALNATLSTLSPDGSAPIVASATAQDDDGDTVTFTWTWRVDGVVVFVGDSLQPALFGKGDAIQAEGLPNDGEDDGNAVLSPVAVATNSAPLATATLSPDPPTTDQTLVATWSASDRDGDPVTVDRWWTVDAVRVADDVDVLDGSAFSKGQAVAFHVLPNDGLVAGPETVATTIVADTAPVVDAAVVEPSDLDVTKVASCAPIGWTDADGDAPAFTVAWFVDGVLESTALTLSAPDFERDDTVYCVLTPDTGVAGVPVTSPAVVVANAPPTPSIAAIEPAAPIWGWDDLLCTLDAAATDPDGDPVTYSAVWASEDGEVAGTQTFQPNDTMPAGSTPLGRTWTCALNVSDGIDTTPGTADVVQPASAGGNILFILADDVGTDKIDAYGEHPNAPPTPNIDRLAAEGTLFRNAYASPTCSPTRANVLTGRYSHRTGVGKIIDVWTYDYALPNTEIGVPQMLALSPNFSYATTLVGKWHLGSMADGPTYPGHFGFDWYAGSLGNLADPSTIGSLGKKDYAYWERNDNGEVSLVTSYATVSSTDDAIARMEEMPQPWLLWLAYNAAHEPLHPPPDDLHSFAGLDEDSTDVELFDAMVESMDTEIGRLLATADPAVMADTHVFFMGDNGTPKHAITPPFDPDKGKGSVREGGVNVPLIAWGPLIADPGSESEAFVHAVDLFATFGVLAGVDVRDVQQTDLDGQPFVVSIDGISLLPYLSDPDRESARAYAFVERFEPNGQGPFPSYARAVRDDRFKLIRTLEGEFYLEELYDVTTGPVEDSGEELLAAGPLSVDAEAAYEALSAELDRLEAEVVFEVPEHPPEVWQVFIEPSPAYATATLTCIPYGARDPDGDVMTFAYSWTVNGVDVGLADDTLAPSYFLLGDEVSCTVTPSDDEAVGQPGTATVTISNAVPTLVGAAILPVVADATTTLSCLPVGAVDLDGDELTYDTTWRIDAAIHPETGQTLVGAFARGETVQCSLVASDGQDESVEVFSDAILIQNDLPDSPVPEILPLDPVAGVDDLWCDVLSDSYDADGDTVYYGFDWLLNGEPYAGPTTTTLVLGDTIPASETENGQGWTCVVTTWDTIDIGDSGHASVWVWDVEPDVWPTGIDFRPVNKTCVAGDRPPSGAAVDLVPAYSIVLEEPMSLHYPKGDDSYWYAVLQDGEIVRFENSPDVETYTVSLDIQDVVRNLPGEQAGMMGMAFDPDFAITGEVLIFYSANGDDLSYPSESRVSRFTSFDGGLTFDPASEEILWSLRQTYIYHKGGQVMFDDDGYFWWAHGDGGGLMDPEGHGQDTFSWFSKVFRVDLRGPDYPWSIPEDNPFADGIGGLPEVWAYGFRNPWRYSLDPGGDLWVGDVGSDQWEEVSLVPKGGNAGWSVQEGAHCVAEPCDATDIVQPAYEWSHDGGAAAVIGGIVYQGDLIPALQGAYLFTDYYGGTPLKSVRKQGESFLVETLMDFTGRRVASFAEDEAQEVFVVDYDAGQIYALVPTEPEASNFPARLSETGCVDAADPHVPAAAMIPFDVVSPLWSDGAAKDRFVALPDGATVGLLDDGDFDFPIGTVFMKNFDVDGIRIETRLLMRHNDGEWAGYSYEWNADGTDADLLDASKVVSLASQDWLYPSQGACLECHTLAANRAVGAETLQLNYAWTYPNGRVANQIETWRYIGLFSDDPGAADTLPAMAAPGDPAAPLEDRARSYLHANCAHCHTEGGTGSGPQDFHYLAIDPAYCDVPPFGEDLGVGPDARILAPGDPEASILYLRMEDLGPERMPPLATTVLDLAALDLVEEWIATMDACTF